MKKEVAWMLVVITDLDLGLLCTFIFSLDRGLFTVLTTLCGKASEVQLLSEGASQVSIQILN
jgi:hypothetical protein